MFEEVNTFSLLFSNISKEEENEHEFIGQSIETFWNHEEVDLDIREQEYDKEDKDFINYFL